MAQGRAETEDAAEQAAIVSAVELALGVHLRSESTLLDDRLHEEIHTLSAGYVSSSKVLARNREVDGSITVTIQAEVQDGMLVDYVRATPGLGSRVLVSESNDWRNQAVTLARVSQQGSDFARIILQNAERVSVRVKTGRPRPVDYQQNSVVLESICELSWDQKEVRHLLVEPMQSLLASVGAQRWAGELRCTPCSTVHPPGWAARASSLSFEVPPHWQPTLLEALLQDPRVDPLVIFDKGGSAVLYDMPQGIRDVIAQTRIPVRAYVVVFECLDGEGRVIKQVRIPLYNGRIFLACGFTEGRGTSVICTDAFMEPVQFAGGAGVYKTYCYDKLRFAWRFELGVEEVAQLKEVRAHVE